MGPKKSLKGQKPPDDKIKMPSEPTIKVEPVNLPHKTNREPEKGKNGGKIKEPEQASKPKPLNKNVNAGSQNVKWILEDGKYYKSKGNKVTLVEPLFFSKGPIAMLVQDGAAPVSGEHFWTANFGGTESYKYFGITSSRWFKKNYGLFYSGILRTFDSPTVEFGPLIKSGDVIGVLCSFAKGHLDLYFYHNGRCLGLAFHVPASLFLPEGICPCVKMDKAGAWATITKEPKENIPTEKDRVRAPVDQFGIEGNWQFKSLVDATTGNVIPLNIDEKELKTSRFDIRQDFGDPPSELFLTFWCTHYVGFVADKKMNNLWTKTRSQHQRDPMRRQFKVWDHSLFVDFPIVLILNNPEKVVLQDQEMRVTKDNQTAVFERVWKFRKGNVFKD